MQQLREDFKKEYNNNRTYRLEVWGTIGEWIPFLKEIILTHNVITGKTIAGSGVCRPSTLVILPLSVIFDYSFYLQYGGMRLSPKITESDSQLRHILHYFETHDIGAMSSVVLFSFIIWLNSRYKWIKLSGG